MQCSRKMHQVQRRLSFHGTSQRDKPATAGTKHGEELKTACISVCHKPLTRGVSCSKIVLVDFLRENRPQKFKSNQTKYQVLPDDLQRWERRKVWETNFPRYAMLHDRHNG